MIPLDGVMHPLAVPRTSTDGPTPPTRARAEESARGFEAIFLHMVIRDMRQTSDAFGEGLFGKESGAQIKEGWFDTMLAERMSATGRVGLADALLDDWEHLGRIPPKETSPASETATLATQRALHALPGTRPDLESLPRGATRGATR